MSIASEFPASENTSDNEHFRDVLDRGLADPARRSLLRRGAGLSAATLFPAFGALACLARVIRPQNWSVRIAN